MSEDKIEPIDASAPEISLEDFKKIHRIVEGKQFIAAIERDERVDFYTQAKMSFALMLVQYLDACYPKLLPYYLQIKKQANLKQANKQNLIILPTKDFKKD